MNVLPVIAENIPAELRNVRQWVCWRYENRNGKPSKVPVDPVSGARAKTNDPRTWESFDLAMDRCRREGLAGIGFVFQKIDPYVGIDLDRVRDPVSGELLPWAEGFIRKANTYAEVSPSGTGVKLYGKGRIFEDGGKAALDDGSAIEMYDTGRYFCVTGHKLDYVPTQCVDIEWIVEQLSTKYFSRSAVVWNNLEAGHVRTSDDKVTDRCRRYVRQMEPAISGKDGSGRCFAAACKCFEFGLSQSAAMDVMREFNLRCQPAWTIRELEHKLQDAERAVIQGGTFGCRM